MQQRSSWQVTKSVWYALLLRDMLNRMFGNRYAWFWLFAEPLLFVSMMVALRAYIRARGDVGGVEIVPWLIIGLTAFFLFRDGMSKAMSAVKASADVFAYKQVKPVDLVFVASVSITVIHAIVIMMFIIGLYLFGYDLSHGNILFALLSWFGLWCLGLSSGLVLSVGISIIPELSTLVKAMTLPLLLISGAMFPVSFFSYEVQQYLLWNPILHAIEFLRLNFFEGYVSISGIDILYVFKWVLPLFVFGLLLHLRFEGRIKAN